MTTRENNNEYLTEVFDTDGIIRSFRFNKNDLHNSIDIEYLNELLPCNMYTEFQIRVIHKALSYKFDKDMIDLISNREFNDNQTYAVFLSFVNGLDKDIVRNEISLSNVSSSEMYERIYKYKTLH